MTTVFIAFYSYKGGVGRSMALANVGWILAARGKRVVLVDMDLEAPSLHGLPDLAMPSESPPTRGIVELADGYAREGRLPALEGHYYGVSGIDGRGALWVMPAGRLDASYQQTLARLSWGELHPQGTEGFVAALRASLKETLQPHYVLIDSRTGFSDVGGLTTHRLADQVVLLFNLTRGCLEGTVRAYRSMTEREEPPHIVLVASPLPPVATEEGTIIQTRLASAREHMPLGLRYGQDILRIDYDPRLVLGERLAVKEGGDLPAVARYRALAETLLQANVDEIIPVVERATALLREGRVRDAIAELRGFVDGHSGEAEGLIALGRLLLTSGQNEEAREVFRRAVALDDASSWSQRGLGEALLGLDEAAGAVEALRRAEALGDKSPEVYQALAAALQASSDPKGADAARRSAAMALLARLTTVPEPVVDERFGDLRARFMGELTRRPPYPGFSAGRFWYCLMGSLTLSGNQKRAVARSVLQGLPAEQLRGLVRIFDEDRAQAQNQLGPDADELQARLASTAPDTQEEILALQRGDEIDGLVLLHAANYGGAAPDLDLLRRAVEVNPNRVVVVEALALTLTNAEGPDQTERWRESLPYWQRAVELTPQDGQPLCNWGVTLGKLARDAEGQERTRLLTDACELFERAVALEPDMYQALYNWAGALLHLAGGAPDAVMSRTFAAEAAEKARAASALQPNIGDYNIACALSRLGDFDASAALVEEVIQRRPELRTHALDDPDLAALWAARPEARERLAAAT